MRRLPFPGFAVLSCALAGAAGCTFPFTILGENLITTFRRPDEPAEQRRDPVRRDARLAVLWIGHASALVQMDDRFILTDPVFTDSVGLLSQRLVKPGLLPEHLPPIDAVLISHMHMDHLSLGSLSMIESKVRQLFVPAQGLVYVPGFEFRSDELPWWQSRDLDGLRVTAVPVNHVGFRYGADGAWMKRSYTGYVVQYNGLAVYFGGDTAYDARLFRETRRRFPNIDVALLPIAPVNPRDFMKRTHIDPEEAVKCYRELGAKVLVPIHFDTFINSEDAPGEAVSRLRAIMKRENLSERAVRILRHGEQTVITPR